MLQKRSFKAGFTCRIGIIMEKLRKIIHVDMDAFFAQIEQRDNPKYKNKPLIVGGPLNRGVVSTASYEARKYGIHSGMPLSRAKRLCPKGIYIPVDMEKYLRESAKIKEVFYLFTPLVETLGSDEGFLDVTGCEKLFGSALAIAKKIKGSIYESTNLTSSAGLGPNKFLAKLASNMGKPNGLTVLEGTDEVLRKIKLLPVSYIWGVGNVTNKELKSMGIETIGDLADTPIGLIEARFGEPGRSMHNMSNGIDNREVVPNCGIKSIGREITYRKDINDFSILSSTLLLLLKKISRNMRYKGYRGKVITLKLRFSDFRMISRRVTLKEYTYGIFDMHSCAVSLLKAVDLNRKKIRLIGVSVSGLKQTSEPDSLLSGDRSRDESLTEAINIISNKFGEDKVTLAKIIEKDDVFD
ncbi:MAG TPA: DNA polymerase IV [Actinobacteria bacterium]|nr:DNA polymerase IV [Actinomycetota bacterium]